MRSCGRFQHDEISCSDAVATIIYKKKNREDYCSTYYSNKNFQDTYAFSIETLPSESTWDIPAHILKVIMIPPIARKQPARPPSNNHKKGFNEEKFKRSKVTYSKCGTSGHDKKTCPNFAYPN
ncbi:hypothetical protein RDI58_024721 [Solanum bulbocastanum]|uniref:CCHC-type domain-containing protein n=1 Tax=Solanum bulbocastanum TaxID=147425 RepID=A0AAN8Y5X2_SOLBU